MVAAHHLEKEAAAIAYDEDVLPVWDEPLGFEIATRLSYSPGSTLLASECRTGSICSSLLNAFDGVRLMAVDSSREMLDLARSRLKDASSVYFAAQRPDSLSYATGVFSAGVCLHAPRQRFEFNQVAAELNRVVRTGGWIALAVPHPRALSLVYDLVRESIWATGEHGRLACLEAHLATLIDVEGVHQSIEGRGGEVIDEGTTIVPIRLGGSASPYQQVLFHAIFGSSLAALESEEQLGSRILADVGRRLDTYLDGVPIEAEAEVIWVLGKTAEVRVEEIYDVDDFDVEEEDEDDGSFDPSEEFDAVSDLAE